MPDTVIADELTPPGAFSLRGFCDAYEISRSKVYDLWQQGRGPKCRKVGGVIKIEHEDARQWFNHFPRHHGGEAA